MLCGLLFSNAYSSDVFDGSIQNEGVYYCKGGSGELKYYSALELNILLVPVYSKSYFQIKINKSFVIDRKTAFSISIAIK